MSCLIPAFPKIFQVGEKYSQGLFDGEVEITEKIDGSAIAFGNIGGRLIIRSKGREIFPESVDKMFKQAVDAIVKSFNHDGLIGGYVYYGEYLQKPRHNVLMYDRVPKNNIVIYGIKDKNGNFISDQSNLTSLSSHIGFDNIPVLYTGHYPCPINGENSLIAELLKTQSYLGGSLIEGIVIKNYNKELLLGGQVIPVLMGKYVSESFKEVHKKNWNAENTGKGKWQVYKSQFNTIPRWNKAIQHLRDKGELTESPSDIGKLIKEVFIDIEQEEKENIKEWLWNEFGKELLRESTKGLPEWYKENLGENLNDKQE